MAPAHHWSGLVSAGADNLTQVGEASAQACRRSEHEGDQQDDDDDD
jgi:hypothetical protein